jgi:hypothetical protein
LRQDADSDAGGDSCPNAGDTFARADDFIVHSRLLQQIEAAFPPPARSIEQGHGQRATVLDLMKSRAGPNGGFTVNDNVVSRDIFGRV